jgi:hypothetical protein
VAITDPYGYEVYTFYRAGILQGNDANGTFAPGSSIKRSEVAAIIARMMEPANRLRRRILGVRRRQITDKEVRRSPADFVRYSYCLKACRAYSAKSESMS